MWVQQKGQAGGMRAGYNAHLQQLEEVLEVGWRGGADSRVGQFAGMATEESWELEEALVAPPASPGKIGTLAR
jgi:hypothetical protein